MALWLRLLLVLIGQNLLGRLRWMAPDGLLLHLILRVDRLRGRLLVRESATKHLLLLGNRRRSCLVWHLQLQLLEKLLLLVVELRMGLNLELRLFNHVVQHSLEFQDAGWVPRIHHLRHLLKVEDGDVRESSVCCHRGLLHHLHLHHVEVLRRCTLLVHILLLMLLVGLGCEQRRDSLVVSRLALNLLGYAAAEWGTLRLEGRGQVLHSRRLLLTAVA